MSSLGNDRGGCGKKLTGVYRTGHPIHLIITILSGEVTLWWVLTWDTSIFTFSAHWERSSHILLPQISLSSNFWSCSIHIFDYPSKALATALQLVYNCTSGHFFFKESAWLGQLLKVLPLRLFPFTTVLQGHTKTGTVVLYLTTFGWYLHIV